MGVCGILGAGSRDDIFDNNEGCSGDQGRMTWKTTVTSHHGGLDVVEGLKANAVEEVDVEEEGMEEGEVEAMRDIVGG